MDQPARELLYVRVFVCVYFCGINLVYLTGNKIKFLPGSDLDIWLFYNIFFFFFKSFYYPETNIGARQFSSFVQHALIHQDGWISVRRSLHT